MENNNEKKTPFKDLANALKKIIKEPLSEKQVDEINSIIEKEVDDSESNVPLDKVVKSVYDKVEESKWEH